jgi:glyoxylase-like metal-dependent hydrolase (beta-lactamase superfamily II)
MMHRSYAGCPIVADVQDRRCRLFDGDRVELFPGVTTITTHGHAPFHQSVLIELTESWLILLAVDAIYTRANLERSAWGSHSDPGAAAEGAALLAQIAAEHRARLVFWHDLGQWHELVRAPDGYYAYERWRPPNERSRPPRRIGQTFLDPRREGGTRASESSDK